jgi:hypothetical protein
MVQRCTNPHNTSYYKYGGRGIRVCDRWLEFANFVHDMGMAPERCSIERIDNEQGYWQGNCRWATPTEQANNKRSNRYVDWQGERLTVAQLSERVGVSRKRICARLDAGWSLERAITPPLQCGRAVKKVES